MFGNPMDFWDDAARSVTSNDNTSQIVAAGHRGAEAVSPSGLISVVSPGQLTESLPADGMKSAGAYELKYLIDRDRAQQIATWARKHLDPDPHAGPQDQYQVNSLYLDTPMFDVFHRTEAFRQRKYRLRRYGNEDTIWLEIKQKRKGLVRKQRVKSSDNVLPELFTCARDREWDGAWYCDELRQQDLRPVTQVTYQRFARIGTTAHGTMRLTIDDHLNGQICKEWTVPSEPLTVIPLLEGQCILELKFQAVMPVLFRQFVWDEQLLTTSFSKYRTSVEECIPLDWIAGENQAGLSHA